jgi:riboflavin kinase/FMN adenylyltransferase
MTVVMRVATSFDEIGELDRPALLTIGTFDGVHRGHLFLLDQARQRAEEHGYGLVIVTFDPCPAVVLRPSISNYQLTSAAQKIRLLQAVSPALVVLLRFTPELSHLTAHQFMDALEARLRLREMWLGEDFHFGRDRSGNLAMLVERGRNSGFGLHVVARRMEDQASISSTRIRQTLLEGDVEGAMPLLGRPFGLDLALASLGEGDSAGQTYHLPQYMLVPGAGWYAGLAGAGATTIRPTLVRIDPHSGQQEITLYSGEQPSPGLEVEFLLRLADLGDLDVVAGLAQAAALTARWQRPALPPTGTY